MQWISTSEHETEKMAQQLVAQLEGGDILLLHGNLGAGKTTLTKALGAALGVKDRITSPTFTLMNVYEIVQTKQASTTVKTLVHVDTYRVHEEQELLDIGIADYLGQNDVLTIIEWPEKIPTILASYQTKKIYITAQDEFTRIFRLA